MKLANLHLVTGYAGYEHVTAADQGAFNVAMLGSGQFVINKGNKLAASVVTNNKIRVADGDIYMQGRFIRLNEGTYVDLTIDNGAQGKKRNDLIVARYTKDSVSGVEEVNLVVIKGTAVASTSNPVDPAYNSSNIVEGKGSLNDMPLYRVPIDGVNVQTLVPLFTLKSILIPRTAADVGAVSKSGDTMTGVLKQVLGDNTTSLTATGDGTYLLNEKGSKSAGLILNPTNGTVTFRHHDGTSPHLYNIYHSGNKPTAADVGAVALNGSNVMMGTLTVDGGANGLNVNVNRTCGSDKRTASLGVFPEGTVYLGNKKNGTMQSYILIDEDKVRFNSDAKNIYATVLHTGNLSAYGVAKIETGSYVGTGSGGASVTCSFEPKMLIVTEAERWEIVSGLPMINFIIWTKGLEKSLGASHQYGNYSRLYTQDGNTVSWTIKDSESNSHLTEKMNESGTTYHYVAIG
jgi:hypothetical protein